MEYSLSVTQNGTNLTFSESYKFYSLKTILDMMNATDPAREVVTDSRGKPIRKLYSIYKDGVDTNSSVNLYLYNIQWKPVDGYTWTASYTYSPQNQQFVNKESQKKPWDRKPDFRKVPAEITIPMEKCYKEGDALGKPTRNIALPNGRPFSTPPMLNINAERFQITWWTRRVNGTAFDECRFSLNAGKIRIDEFEYSRGALLMESCFYSPLYDTDDTVYYQCEASILYRQDGHNFKPLYADYQAIFGGKCLHIQQDPDSGEYGSWPSDTKKPKVTDPVPLNEDGTLLVTNPNENKEWIFGNFQIYPAVDWTPLGIPKVKGVFQG